MNHPFVDSIVAKFEKYRDLENAPKMSAYMKNHFPFLGIQAPVRKELYKDFKKETKELSVADLELIINQLWELPEREYQYLAMQLLEDEKQRLTPSHIEFVVSLIVAKSWWDTIDNLAPKIIGTILANYPELKEEYIPLWVESDNIWLNRTAILFQLKYKNKTDFQYLTNIIDELKHKQDFFVKKAIGWALREYSKINARLVEDYIKTANLQPLSEKEGLKHIIKNKN